MKKGTREYHQRIIGRCIQVIKSHMAALHEMGGIPSEMDGVRVINVKDLRQEEKIEIPKTVTRRGVFLFGGAVCLN